MVDFGHRWRDGECAHRMCPYCQFISELCDVIEEANDKPEHVWNKALGELQDRLFDAVWAIHRTRRTGFAQQPDPIANEFEAASKLVAVFKVLDDFREKCGIDLSYTPGDEDEDEDDLED